MKTYNTYQEAEDSLIREIVLRPQFVTNSTYEIIGTGFVLREPHMNRNNHSNYDYADKFFTWLMSGETKLSKELLDSNPWVERFTTSKGLPENFSASYGWKIKTELPLILDELRRNHESRRGYLNILHPDDKVILGAKTTHEYPCTIGVMFLIRDERLHMFVNMRSNNVYAVMPYDVYNFTMLLEHVAEKLKLPVGRYYHQIISAHLYKGDVRRIRESLFVKED